MLEMITQLFPDIASLAGIEPIFTTYRLIHSKIINRLGIKRFYKLVAVFNSLNKHYDNKTND